MILEYLKVSKCVGNGQSSCKGCSEKGIWNVHWASWLYHIEGLEGCYCDKCVMDLDKLMGVLIKCSR